MWLCSCKMHRYKLIVSVIAHCVVMWHTRRVNRTWCTLTISFLWTAFVVTNACPWRNKWVSDCLQEASQNILCHLPFSKFVTIDEFSVHYAREYIVSEKKSWYHPAVTLLIPMLFVIVLSAGPSVADDHVFCIQILIFVLLILQSYCAIIDLSKSHSSFFSFL
jgi:hypothetical protein